MSEHITPETMKLNEFRASTGFTTEPRILSHEVFKMREQVSALCGCRSSVGRVAEREANKKVEAALHPINTEAA